MSKARLVITAVVVEGRGVREVARDYGVSPGWVSKLVARFPATRGGHHVRAEITPAQRLTSRATPAETVELIIELRRRLIEGRRRGTGLETIRWHHATHHGVVAVSRDHRPLLAPGRALSRHSHTSVHARPMCASRRSSRMRRGRPTSPTTGPRPARMSRCCAGWMITPATRCGSPRRPAVHRGDRAERVPVAVAEHGVPAST